MLIRLLHPLMIDGIDHPAGDLVNPPDQVAQEWITQRLAQPVPLYPAASTPIQTATLPPPPSAADHPAQRRRRP